MALSASVSLHPLSLIYISLLFGFLLDYLSEVCGPCKMISPLVEEMASEYADRLRVGKVDVDQNQILASEQNVASIPTLLIFKDGEVVAQQVGAVNKSQLANFIESNL